MLNAEKYKDAVIQTEGFFGLFERRKVVSCDKMQCESCDFFDDSLNECSSERVLWLLEEYEEPKIDWNKVPVDTKVLVFDKSGNWQQRHFAKYEDNTIYVWKFGRTSWSAFDGYEVSPVQNVKLAEEN